MQDFDRDGPTDELVSRAIGGDRAARDEIASLLMPRVRAMVVVRLTPRGSQFDIVDDLAQKSLVGVLEGIPKLRAPTTAALFAFASIVVSRRVIDHLRESNGAGDPVRSIDRNVTEGSSLRFLRDLLTASGLTPHRAAAQAETIERMLVELGRLKSEHREIIAMAFFDQLAMSDIAERMEISRPAASMLLIRALKSLRRAVTGSADPEDDHASSRG